MKISLFVGLPSREAEEDRLDEGAERDLKNDMISLKMRACVVNEWKANSWGTDNEDMSVPRYIIEEIQRIAMTL